MKGHLELSSGTIIGKRAITLELKNTLQTWICRTAWIKVVRIGLIDWIKTPGTPATKKLYMLQAYVLWIIWNKIRNEESSSRMLLNPYSGPRRGVLSPINPCDTAHFLHTWTTLLVLSLCSRNWALPRILLFFMGRRKRASRIGAAVLCM
jgi:hypothetical protein